MYGEEFVAESNVLLGHDIEKIIRIKQKETIIEQHFNTSSENDFGEDFLYYVFAESDVQFGIKTSNFFKRSPFLKKIVEDNSRKISHHFWIVH